MTASEIIQIIIGILSLVATVAVSFFIYWLQNRHEKEIAKMEEAHRQGDLAEEANNFLIDHDDERDYLPWCTMAANLHRHERHSRKIYTDFCRCPVELQNKILEMAEFTIRTIEGAEWVDSAFEQLECDVKKYNLGVQPFLYDGAKYFHRAFSYYREHKFEQRHNREFKTIYELSPILLISEKDKDKVSLSHYVDQYFDYILGRENKALVVWENPYPPVDYVWNTKNLGSIKEVAVCYWIMELVENFIVNIHNRLRVSGYDSMIWDNSTDAQAETYEDRYYEILYWMYYTYCYKAEVKELIEPKPKKLKQKKKKDKNIKTRIDKS